MGESLIQSREHISVELLPSNGPQDQPRFQADVARVSDLIRGKTAHTFVTTSLPYFPRSVVFMARKLRTWFQTSDFLKKVSGEHRDLIVSLLAEMTHRQPSHTVGPLEADVESRHIRTMPAQMYDWRTLQDNLRHLQNPAGLFVVSGGHPLRKIQKTLEIYGFHIAWLDYLLNGGLGQVDVREFMTDVRDAFPQKPLLGAWNYHTDTRGRVASKVHHGMQGMISQPASFMPDTFHRALMDLRSIPEGREIPILVGLPHVTSVAALKFWFILMNIIPEKHPEAAYLLENFQRAKKDGYVGAFSDQFTRHCIEWALALPGTAGIHFMGSKGESFELLRDVVGMGRHQNGFDHIAYENSQILHQAEQLYDVEGIKIIIPPGLYSSETKPRSGPQYSQELFPLLPPLIKKLKKIQGEFPGHSFWKKCEVHFFRMSANNHAHILPIEVITSDEDIVHEIRIDVRYDYSDPQEFLVYLERALRAHLQNGPIPDAVLFEDNTESGKSLLERLQSGGWDWFGALQKARGESGDAGTESAKSPDIIRVSAKNILESLEMAGDMSEYIILEVGTWYANGIPEILDCLEGLLQGHKQENVLRERLKRIKYFCADMSSKGVQSCRNILGDTHEKLGIQFDYMTVNLMKDEDIRAIYEKYKGKVIFTRSINVLEALQNRQYVKRHHQMYDMNYSTGISRSDLKKICSSTIYYHEAPLDQDDHEKCTKKSLALSLDCDAILSFFSDSQPGPDNQNEVTLFLEYLHSKCGISLPAGLVIFEKILQAMKKYHRYHLDKRRDSIVARVGAYHPDPEMPMTDSHQATTYLMTLAHMLHPQGRGFFAQLQRTLGSHAKQSHSSNCTPHTYHITPCNPLADEAAHIVASKEGFRVETISGADLGLRPSSGGLLLRRQ